MIAWPGAAALGILVLCRRQFISSPKDPVYGDFC